MNYNMIADNNFKESDRDVLYNAKPIPKYP